MAYQDIYIKTEGDPGFQTGLVEIHDELDQLLQQIEMCLFTRQGDILGEHLLGIDLEAQIYTLNISANVLEVVVMDQINTFCPLANKYKVRVSVKFYRGTERDIAAINIVINDSRSTSIVIA